MRPLAKLPGLSVWLAVCHVAVRVSSQEQARSPDIRNDPPAINRQSIFSQN